MTTMTLTPELRTIGEQTVAIIPIRTTPGGIPEAVGTAYGELEAALRTAGVEMTGPPFSRYLDFGSKMITFEAGFPVARLFPETGRVMMSTLPAGPVATVVHVGPYERLETTHAALAEWVEAQDREPAGPMWEVYLTDPGIEPDPERWRTEVVIPIR